MYLNDGSKVGMYWFIGPNYSAHGNAVIDVNGDKEPNLLGRDIFMFQTHTNGTLIPYGSAQYDTTYCGASGSCTYGSDNKSAYGCDPADTPGNGCAGRVIDEGWVMNY